MPRADPGGLHDDGPDLPDELRGEAVIVPERPHRRAAAVGLCVASGSDLLDGGVRASRHLVRATVRRRARGGFARTGHLRAGRGWPVLARRVSPRRAASAAAALRECRPSLPSRFVTWRCTVCSLSTSRSAICRFVSPSAISASTSRSRALSGSSASGRRGSRGRGERPQSRRSPAPTPRRRRSGPAEGGQARRQLAASERGLVRGPGALVAVDRVLEQRAGLLVVAAGRVECAVRAVGARAHRRARVRADRRGERRSPRRRDRGRPPRRRRARAARAPERARAAGRRGARAARARRAPAPRAAARDRGPAERGTAARPSWRRPGRGAPRPRRSRPSRRRSSASATSAPPAQAGRERSKSATAAASTSSASAQRPRQRCSAPYSARQKASMYRLL